MNAIPELPIDEKQVAEFLQATFRYAGPETYISLRGFYEDESRVFLTQGRQVGDDLNVLLPAISRCADRCARAARPVVFAPPLATFVNPQQATEEALANGLMLSVECDSKPLAARDRLEGLLGPATVAVISGGEWTDPETGEVQDKLHLHWRLNEPTRAAEDHHRLKRARILATRLVGGDATNQPVVHPIRWPGSWHRKGTPRLARIISLTEAEVDLADALERLDDAVSAAGLDEDPTPGAKCAGPGRHGEERQTAELIRAVLRAEDYHAPLTALAMRFLRGGMPDAQVVLTLRGLMLAVPEADRDRKDGAIVQSRWQARYDDIPRTVSTARAKCGGPGASDGDPNRNWGEPIDFFTDPNSQPPELRAGQLPEALFGFVTDTAERMGVDPTSVALGCLVSCASVVSDDWRLQPKRYDYTWTESPRLWGAIVGEPSILKTPVISACTKPIDKLDADARRRHREAMRQYKQKLKETKADKSGATPDPVHPRLDRYLVEGATIEAISEVLRDDDEATQRAPAGKVLSRWDEMSEFFGGLDRYKAGGKGGADRGAYLRLFNGGPYMVDRVLRGAFSIPNWSACFLGGIQPGPIQKIAKDTARASWGCSGLPAQANSQASERGWAVASAGSGQASPV